MVVDTSVVLAIFFQETHAQWAAAKLNTHATELRMSTVNLTETLILLADRQPQNYQEMERHVLESGIRFVPPTVEQSKKAALARLRYPLNLGDCFAYALAAVEGCPVLTLDADFRRVDCPIVHPNLST